MKILSAHGASCAIPETWRIIDDMAIAPNDHKLAVPMLIGKGTQASAPGPLISIVKFDLGGRKLSDVIADEHAALVAAGVDVEILDDVPFPGPSKKQLVMRLRPPGQLAIRQWTGFVVDGDIVLALRAATFETRNINEVVRLAWASFAVRAQRREVASNA